MTNPPDHLRQFARGAMVVDAIWSPVGTPSEQARVWLLSYESEPLAIMKFHRHLDSALREATFYQSWATDLTGRVPRWFGQCPREPRAMLLGVVEGGMVSGDGSTVVQTKAARFLASLHSTAYLDRDPIPPAQALKLRMQSAIERATGVVDDTLLEQLSAPELSSLRLYRVPCHRDFGPHNWLIRGPEERLSVVDFGQSRPDVFLADLIKLVPAWIRSDEHLSAFFAGYDKTLSAAEWGLLRLMVGHYAIGSIVWARKRGQECIPSEGRALLDAFDASDWWSARSDMP